MRHRWMGRKLGRNNSGRKALEKHMVCALFTYGRIVTTVEKAKEFRSSAERLITLAKKGGLSHYRMALADLQDKKIVRKLFADIAGRFKDRPGGYTRIIKLGGNRFDGEGRGKWASHRLGDGGSRAIFELVVLKTREEELQGLGRRDEAAASPTSKKDSAKKEEPKKKGKKLKAAAAK